MSHVTSAPRLRQLVVCLGSAFALGNVAAAARAADIAPAALARYVVAQGSPAVTALLAGNNLVVSSCADDGSAGTLRAVIGSAAAGDTIDMSGLPAADPGCSNSTITLTQGGISIYQDLVLSGPSNAALAIVGSGTQPVLSTGGQLQISYLTIRGGRSNIVGGCIYGSGAASTVTLQHSTVTDCTATGFSKYRSGSARGGGIFANAVALTEGSLVSSSQANGVPQGDFDDSHIGVGGGIYAKTQFTCSDSTISGNLANLDGGGVATRGSTAITRCTIESNMATSNGGGIFVYGTTGTLAITDSTLSGNVAELGAALNTNLPLALTGSTVAFNVPDGIFSAANVSAQSSIVAMNGIATGDHADLWQFAGTLTGADNLIVSTNAVAGAGVITENGDPRLAPLAHHGGLTRTHALLASSPAIDHGNNAGNQANDQRGVGFPREVPDAKPDIGAYERQVNDDEIFYAGFD